MNKQYDVIVIGAGNGGLAAGAAMAVAGKKVVVMERHNLPGGSASSFVRGRYEFEPSLHEMASTGPEEHPGPTRQIFKDLDAAPFKLCTEDKLYRMITLDNGNINALLPMGREKFIDEIERQVPGSRASVAKAFELTDKINAGLAYATGGDVKLPTLFKEHDELLRALSHTASEYFDILEMPVKAQSILANYWPYVGVCVNDMDFFTFMKLVNTYVEYGPAMPEKKSHEMSLAIENSIHRHGGDVWYNCEVKRIIVEDGTVKGVVANGHEYYADHVICNGFPSVAFTAMMDSAQVPKKEFKIAKTKTPGMAILTMYLGLNKSAEELGIKDYSTFVFEDTDPVKQFEAAQGGLYGKGWLIVNCLNIVIPESSPDGTCTLFFSAPVYGDNWGKVRPEDYKKTKTEIANELIDHYEKATGISVRPYIEEYSLASPSSVSRYLNTPNGTPYGYKVSMKDSIFLRQVTGMIKKPPIKGLRFAGVTEMVDGYNSGYMCGQKAAAQTLKDMEEGE